MTTITNNKRIIDILEGAEEIARKHNLPESEPTEDEALALASISHAFLYHPLLRKYIHVCWRYFLVHMTNEMQKNIETVIDLMRVRIIQLSLGVPKMEPKDEQEKSDDSNDADDSDPDDHFRN